MAKAKDSVEEEKVKPFATTSLPIAEKAQELGFHLVGIKVVGISRKTGGNIKRYTFVEDKDKVERALTKAEGGG